MSISTDQSTDGKPNSLSEDDRSSQGSWRSLSTADDVESICDEVWDSLYEYHDNIHESLYKLTDSSSGYVTCTVVTHSPPEQNPYHLLLLADSYRDIVSSYIGNHSGNILKITTSHVKSRILLEKCKLQFKTHPYASISKLPNHQHSNQYLDMDAWVFESLAAGASYRHHNMSVEFPKEDSIVRFQIHSGAKSMDSVNGSFTVMKTDATIADIVKPLDTLNNPESSKIVTVIVMAVTDSSGELLTLYKFSAGDIKDNPESMGENWMLFKVNFTNDKVFEQIQQMCRVNFFKHLEKGLMEKWEKESPLFIVTAVVSIGDTGRLFTVEPIRPDLPDSGTGRKKYTFRHPCSDTMFFDVYEPASPADAVGHCGLASDGSSNSVSFSMAGAEAAGSEPIVTETIATVHSVKEQLLRKQAYVISSLRQNHEEKGGPFEAMTAVISTSMTNGKITTSIILVSGIVRGSNQMDGIDEENKAGWILSFSSIYSKHLKQRVERTWCRSVRDDHMKGWPCNAKALIDRNGDLDWKEFRKPSMHTTKRMGFKEDGIRFERIGQRSFLIGNGTDFHTEEVYDLCKDVGMRTPQWVTDDAWERDIQEAQRTSQTVKEGLLRRQREVIMSFRRQDRTATSSTQTVTAVISTSMHPNASLTTHIILVSGVIEGSNRTCVPEERKIGWILSFSSIASGDLKRLVEAEKSPVCKGLPCFARVIDYQRCWTKLEFPEQHDVRSIGFKMDGIRFESIGYRTFVIEKETDEKKTDAKQTNEKRSGGMKAEAKRSGGKESGKGKTGKRKPRKGTGKQTDVVYHHLNFADMREYQQSLVDVEEFRQRWTEDISQANMSARRLIDSEMVATSDHTTISITAIEARGPQSIIQRPLTCSKDIVYVVAIGDPSDVGTPVMFKYHDVLNLIRCCTWSEDRPDFAHLVETYWQTEMTKNKNHTDIIESTKEACKKAKHIILHMHHSKICCHTSFDPNNYVRFPLKCEKDNIPFEVYSHEAKPESLKWHITDPQVYETVRNTLEEQPDKNQPVNDQMIPGSLIPNSFKHPIIKINVLNLAGVPSSVGTPIPGSQPEGACQPGVQCYYLSTEDESHMKFARPGTGQNAPAVHTVLKHLPRDKYRKQ